MTAEAGEATQRQTFLFLQGPSSPLFARIGDNLERLGHRCIRINLCAGDWVFWRRAGAINYRGRLDRWPAFVAAIMDRERVTGLVLLGEERPHHLDAIAAAKARGIAVYAVEMGYLRPDWIRIERGGSGHHSHFPANPATILSAAAGLPEPDLRAHYSQTFLSDAVFDLMFNLPNVFAWFFYPHYRWHAIFHPLAEYYGWIGRLLSGKRRAKEAEATIAKVVNGSAPYFVMPLQLETDYQIRSYSVFRSQRTAIKLVISSFADNADPNARLLIKVHPLDNGLIKWPHEIKVHAQRHGVADRVHFIDGGNLNRMIAHSAGVVTINSTAGMVGLQHGIPVKTLGLAIYDVPGMTDDQPLDRFWREAKTPDAKLVSAFVRLIAATVHVRGNFYSESGVNAGAASIAERLHENTVNQPGGFVDEPQRRRPDKDNF
ncbi:capsular biosynthesis protein [Mesorhizobium sp. LHD-90]|uniref:capsule biosynthesis protein n=1 Tax=Mesorhizobium sp. LHD-90 TaxID=3071414 RepID=UPI0027DED72C|nr:capsular biosynthesis protein [Mesorhizobium sp. LHD-90]MDQ6434987.1 capsular biosynthesis protein [Mesorhizobium sp. LHD-90]